MGERLTLRVFKGPSKLQFRRVVEDVAIRHGGFVEWDAIPDDEWLDFRVSHQETVHTVLLPYRDGADYFFCKRVAEQLAVPWIELRIQEGTFWDYSLFFAGEHLDNFSTLPEYWGEDDTWNRTQRGNAQLLATTWRIERHQIERYLLPWGFQRIEDEEYGAFQTTRRGKAYDRDQHEYGDIWQLHDFLRAIGGVDPYDFSTTEFQHRIKLPDAKRLKDDHHLKGAVS